MWNLLSYPCKVAVYVAQEVALKSGCTEVDARHLLVGTLRTSGNARLALTEAGIDPDQMAWELVPLTFDEPGDFDALKLSSDGLQAINHAYHHARKVKGDQWFHRLLWMKVPRICTDDLALGCLDHLPKSKANRDLRPVIVDRFAGLEPEPIDAKVAGSLDMGLVYAAEEPSSE